MSGETTKPRIFIIPGNGAGDVTNCMWYPWLRDKVNDSGIAEGVLRNMPDPIEAKRSIWLKFMSEELGIGPNDIIVGHSSGAVAAIRYAETTQVGGIILVGAYSSHLGDQLEKASGYFDGPWKFENVRENCQRGGIVQFGSSDDPFLPWDTQQDIADGLKAKLFKSDDKGHFQASSYPEIVKEVQTMVKAIMS